MRLETHKNRAFLCLAEKMMGPVHCSCNLQIFFSSKTTLKPSPTTLFTYLKIILLQCFQFSGINGIQTNPQSIKGKYLQF